MCLPLHAIDLTIGLVGLWRRAAACELKTVSYYAIHALAAYCRLVSAAVMRFDVVLKCLPFFHVVGILNHRVLVLLHTPALVAAVPSLAARF